MTVFLIPNLSKPNAADIARDAALILHKNGADVCLEQHAKDAFDHLPFVKWVSQQEAFSCCDAVVTVGGDGTMLHAARDGLPYNKPIVGINLGHMGFLATVETYELETKLKRLVSGDYIHDTRSLLQVTTADGSQFTALNDAVIGGETFLQMLDVCVYCDDILVHHFNGNGVIVSTSTGSTAYSLSAGGPILDARIAGLVVAPLCAHSMQSPPMVFSYDRRISISIKGNDAFLGCDGVDVKPIGSDERTIVSLSDRTVTLISFNKADQFEAIDKKLRGK